MQTGIARSIWVEARMNELPKYVKFLYNLLLDPKCPDDLKEHAFGALYYVFEGADLLPPDDPMLGGLDALAFVFRCMSEMVGRLPQATLSVYEEVLLRDGVPLRQYLPQAAQYLDKFFFAVASLYKERIARYQPYHKNAIKTGYLVKMLQAFLGAMKPAHWAKARLDAVESFLGGFQLPQRQGQPGA